MFEVTYVSTDWMFPHESWYFSDWMVSQRVHGISKSYIYSISDLCCMLSPHAPVVCSSEKFRFAMVGTFKDGLNSSSVNTIQHSIYTMTTYMLSEKEFR